MLPSCHFAKVVLFPLVEYDTELSHFTLVIIAVSAEELTFFCMFFRILILFTFSRLRHK